MEQPSPAGNHPARRVILLAALIALLALFASSDPVHDAVLALAASLARVADAHSVAGALLFVGLSALSAMLAFFSSSVFVPVAVFAWGERLSILLLWSGWLVGGVLSYVAGRYLGRPILHWVKPPHLAWYEGRAERLVSFPLVVLFQLALPSEIPGYVLGVVRYRFLSYLLALSLTELPFAIGAVVLGRSFVRQQWLVILGVGVAGLLVTGLAAGLFRRKFGSHDAEGTEESRTSEEDAGVPERSGAAV